MPYIIVYADRSKRRILGDLSTSLTLDDLKKAIVFWENRNKQIKEIKEKGVRGAKTVKRYVRRINSKSPELGYIEEQRTVYKRLGRPPIVIYVVLGIRRYMSHLSAEDLIRYGANIQYLIRMTNTDLIKTIENYISEKLLLPPANRYKVTKSTLRTAKILYLDRYAGIHPTEEQKRYIERYSGYTSVVLDSIDRGF